MHNRHRHSPLKHVENGRSFEKEFFGEKAVFDPIPLEAYQVAKRSFRGTFRECLYEAKKYTQKRVGWDPKHPSTTWATFLFYSVQQRLPAQYREQLELFCAIGSRLDFYYGVDAFFAVGDAVVTIDLQLSLHDKHPIVDIIVLRKRYDFLNHLIWISSEVAKLLNQRIHDHEQV